MENEIKKENTTLNNELNDEIDLEITEVNLPEYVLEVKDLYKSYGTKQVLKGLNLQVKKGEVFGFIGKNGIGKSTALKVYNRMI